MCWSGLKSLSFTPIYWLCIVTGALCLVLRIESYLRRLTRWYLSRGWIWCSSHLKGGSDSFWKVTVLSYFRRVSIILWRLDHSSSDTNSVLHFAVVILKNLGNGDIICSPVGQWTPFISGLSNLIFGEKKSCFLLSYSYSLECEVLLALKGHDSSDTNSVLTFCWDDFENLAPEEYKRFS